MTCTRSFLLLLVCLTGTALSVNAQFDSISSVTTSEYRDDTLFWQDLTIQNYIGNKLIFEYKKYGLNSDESSFEMTTHFYDLEGTLIRSEVIEEDRYACPPEPVSELFYSGAIFEFHLFDSTGSAVYSTYPDSIENGPKFCGRYATKTTEYLPHIHISKSSVHYDESDSTFAVDSVFFNRYGDEIRKVSYVNGKKGVEYRYSYLYDESGRITEQVWDNLTPGYEFRNKAQYVYDGERKVQVYHSMHFFKEPEERYSRSYYDADFNIIRHENYVGDSLTATYHYSRSDQGSAYFGVTSSGDTVNVAEFVTKKHNNGSESWSSQSIRSEEYQYSITDTLYKKNGYCIEVARYSITPEQFRRRERPSKTKNRLVYSSRRVFDLRHRLLTETEYTEHGGAKRFGYVYGGR